MKQTSSLPKYIQVSEMLIRQITAGQLANGSRLPPERDMAHDLEIAVGTLRKALADVEQKGLLERIQGSGNYVRNQSINRSLYALFRLELKSGGGLPTAQVLTIDRLTKPQDAPGFGTCPDGHRIRRLRSLNGQLIALEEIWLDGGHCDVIDAAEVSESLYHFYREKLGLMITSVEDKIGVDRVPTWSPIIFSDQVGDTAGFVERIAHTAAGQPSEYSRTWFDAQQARYVSRMGEP